MYEPSPSVFIEAALVVGAEDDFYSWYSYPDLNRDATRATNFKSDVSTYSTIRASNFCVCEYRFKIIP